MIKLVYETDNYNQAQAQAQALMESQPEVMTLSPLPLPPACHFSYADHSRTSHKQHVPVKEEHHNLKQKH